MDKRRSRQLTFYIAILILGFSIPCLTSASVFDVRQNFPEHIQGNNGIYLQYRNGSNYVDMINYNPFGGGGLSNDYVFVNPDLTDPDHFPTILAYEYNNPVPSLNQISAAPSCIPRSNINADAVIRINLSDNGGQVQIKGSCGRSSSDDVYFTIYKGAGNYSSPVWSTWNSGIIDVTIPYSKGDQLFFATNSGTSCTDGNLAYWKDLQLIITPVAAFNGMSRTGPAPFIVTFTDQSTGSPTGWAWYFGDETYTAPWTLVNASGGWSPRYMQTCVLMEDGSIVLMGGQDEGGPKNDVWRSTNKGVTWTQVNASAGWSPRSFASSVVIPDGSIVLIGGANPDTGGHKNDVWRSTDKGVSWIPITSSAEWPPRSGHTSVLMPDGSIVLIGGSGVGGLMNDVWRSINNGVNWTQVNASAGWTPRVGHNSVVMADGSIVLMGGHIGTNSHKNDVWRSTNEGVTWTQVNASAGWVPRSYSSSVVMPDGSIVLTGGQSGIGYGPYYNDVWRSTDMGATWSQVTASAEWTGRLGHSSVVMPDGSIVMMDGWIGYVPYKNDVWRFMPVGSSAKNPSHTYTNQGIYNVALQAYNAFGYNSIRKVGYITVTPVVASFIVNTNLGKAPLAVTFTDTSTGTAITEWDWSFGDGSWFNTTNTDLKNPMHIYSTTGTYTSRLTVCNSNGCNTTVPGTNITTTGAPTNIGVSLNDGWWLDSNSNGRWDQGVDTYYSFGSAGVRPVTGDWNGDRKTEIGVQLNDGWWLDSNGNGRWDQGVDTYYSFGSANVRPVTGKWS